MRLLLHVCCGPCLIYPYEVLSKNGYEVEGLFYNPNIHPLAEYNNRKKAIEDFSAKEKIKVNFDNSYKPEEFFQAVAGREKSPDRCELCWKMRLKETARLSKEKGFDSFSTTLLVSPYQDIDKINKIGEDIAKESGVKFIFQDFRSGFRQAHNKAKELGMYCQKYCGCLFSEIERYERT
ncbi:MAG: epoxyqueuosine reductase QueH [Candidatus Omnitrophica bacterium]|nr:epoxyqueuosine reductase QueH [Candidatus Omnitrophota bacterium]HOX54241.1 epoxyqueuosine reductase QueH [Candidatus Omnitrophota bacterium]